MIVRITDKSLLRERLGRAHRINDEGARFLLDAVGAELADRVAGVERSFPIALAIGGQTAALAQAIGTTGKVGEVFRLEQVRPVRSGPAAIAVGDEEQLPIGKETVNLVVSALTLQWANDLPGALVQIRQALQPDGLFIAAMAGGRTLSELRDVLVAAETEIRGGASPRVLPFAEVRDVGALLQRAGFALPVTDRDVFTVRYDTVFELMRDLRAMAATNVLLQRERRVPERRLFLRAAEIYAERFGDPDGRIRASFEIIYMSGWAPHESQQKPAQRGSGQVSLAAVLGTRRSP